MWSNPNGVTSRYSSQMANNADPTQGWYSDPWGVESLRWWDGHAWTGHTAPSGDDLPRSEEVPLGASTKAGDAIRAVRFRETLKGYNKDAVDELLSHAAAEVDAGRTPTSAFTHAPFPESLKGYHRDDVDDFIRHLAASPSMFSDATSTNPFAHDASISSSHSQTTSNHTAVWTSKSSKLPHRRSAAKGWTPLKWVLSAIFLVGGAFAVIAGVATWHSEASRPHVVAVVTSQFHCVTDNDTGPACDERIVFEVGTRQIHTVVRGIEPSRDLYGPPGHQSITVFYDPTAPTHVEAVDGVARSGMAMILGGIATIIGVVVIGALITRDGRKLDSRPEPTSEIYRSIVS
jgi:DivIVA domain-containing protein